MAGLSGTGSGQARPTNPLTTEEGLKALQALQPDSLRRFGRLVWASHRDSENLRGAAERYRQRRTESSENWVQFQMDPESGMIWVNVKDDLTGDFRVRMTPEDVERVLKSLEETEENESTLSSFFIDMKL